MLYFREVFRRLHDLAKAFIVKFVRNRPRRFCTERSTDRNDVVLLRHILVDGVVRKTGQRETSACEEHLDLIRRRELADTIENLSGLVVSQHSAISN